MHRIQPSSERKRERRIRYTKSLSNMFARQDFLKSFECHLLYTYWLAKTGKIQWELDSAIKLVKCIAYFAHKWDTRRITSSSLEPLGLLEDVGIKGAGQKKIEIFGQSLFSLKKQYLNSQISRPDLSSKQMLIFIWYWSSIIDSIFLTFCDAVFSVNKLGVSYISV